MGPPQRRRAHAAAWQLTDLDELQLQFAFLDTPEALRPGARALQVAQVCQTLHRFLFVHPLITPGLFVVAFILSFLSL